MFGNRSIALIGSGLRSVWKLGFLQRVHLVSRRLLNLSTTSSWPWSSYHPARPSGIFSPQCWPSGTSSMAARWVSGWPWTHLGPALLKSIWTVWCPLLRPVALSWATWGSCPPSRTHTLASHCCTMCVCSSCSSTHIPPTCTRTSLRSPKPARSAAVTSPAPPSV